MSEQAEAHGDLGATPHIWISQHLKPSTAAKRDKVRAEVIEKFGLEDVEAETLVSAAADVDQLVKSLSNPIVYNVGKHTFRYIELDVVTWRILPSPENVRFEDQRMGVKDVVRFGALEGSKFPVLTLNVKSTADLIANLALEAAQIRQENPHTRTIPSRGIENAGWLSLTRVIADDASRPFGVLDATDGFSRTVGAHDGLQITAKDVLTKFTNHFDETDFRKYLLKLKKDDLESNSISEVDAAKLRSSVMRRARVIIDYAYEGNAQTKTFDKARRTLVGHLHLAPQHSFSAAAKSATKASAISDALYNESQIAALPGLNHEQLFEVLQGNLEPWLKAGYTRDQYAVFILSTYRPKLSTRQGKVIKGAIEDLTSQTVKTEELAEIAADVAIRPIVLEKRFQEVGAEQLSTRLRSILGKTWNVSLFQGVRFTGRPLDEITDAAVAELEATIKNGPSSTGFDSRAELATMASFAMVALVDKPILERAVGRTGHGNNDEPAKVMAELVNRKEGILQIAQIVMDVRDGNTPRILEQGETPASVRGEDIIVATAGSVKQIYLEKAPYPEELPAAPEEVLNTLVYRLANGIENVASIASEIANVEDDSGVVIVQQRGLNLENEIQKLNEILQTNLSVWNGLAKMNANSLRQRIENDVDLG